MAEDNKKKHNIIMNDREIIKITGILDVISFDDLMVITDTEQGILIIKGDNLHVNQLNLDSGELGVDGIINSLTYEDREHYGKPGSSFFSKIFK